MYVFICTSMLKSDAPWFHRISFRVAVAIDFTEPQVGFGRYKKKHGVDYHFWAQLYIQSFIYIYLINQLIYVSIYLFIKLLIYILIMCYLLKPNIIVPLQVQKSNLLPWCWVNKINKIFSECKYKHTKHELPVKVVRKCNSKMWANAWVCEQNAMHHWPRTRRYGRYSN